MATRYRVVEVNTKNSDTYYIIQFRFLLFFWLTIKDSSTINYAGDTYVLKFRSEKEACDKMTQFVIEDDKTTIKKKKIIAVSWLLIIFLAAGLSAHSQCERNLNVSMSTSLGIDKEGWTEGMEFGVWGVDQPFGVMVGFVMNNTTKAGVESGKAIIYKEFGMQGLIRLTAKVYQDDMFYHVLTSYYTTSNDIGFSYRLYKQFGDHVVIGLEPSASFKRGGAVQTVFTFNF